MSARLAGRILVAALAAWSTWSVTVMAHIGSPDVFVHGQAGPYRVFVTVRPPYAIPGVAEVEVLTTSDDVHEIRIVPLPLTGPGAQFAPVPDVASRSSGDPRLFTGTLWMMTAGAWQVRIAVGGDRGDGQLSVPVPTLPKATLAMSRPLGVLLAGLMILLCTGFVAIVATITRDAGLEPGQVADAAHRRRGRIAGTITAMVIVAAVYFGNVWWNVEATNYSRYVYRPLEVTPTVAADTLRLRLDDPGWLRTRRLDDFIADHGHLMHLFIVSPDLDQLWHLHPRESGIGTFEHPLPPMPAGRYELFGDLVHRTGVSETVTASFETPAVPGAPLRGDDSAWSTADPVGTRITWIRGEEALVPKRLTTFTFRVEDETGQPARDLELYMGMPGHAVFIRRDRAVFAHVHPSGSAPMALLGLAQGATAHAHEESGFSSSDRPRPDGLPPSITFPYGFPEPGDYRIFVQVKRAGQIATRTFDAHVE